MKRISSCSTFFCVLLACCILLSGCTAKQGTASSASSVESVYTANVLIPEADGTVVYETETSSIDASHATDGYIMAKYSGSYSKVKLLITTPSGSQYQYRLTPGGDYQTFPLTEGAGQYTFAIFENVSGEQYAPDLTQTVQLDAIDEFGPYLYPSQYVNFNSGSRVVSEAEKLAAGATEDLEVLERVYSYAVKNIVYDSEKAATVQSGYVPEPDEILASGKGICFDYAAVVASMLRSLGIPTQLQVGYMGTLYHAWISTHIEGLGWVNGVIEFDGEEWKLMDPTTAASKGEKATAEFLNTAGTYTTKYKY